MKPGVNKKIAGCDIFHILIFFSYQCFFSLDNAIVLHYEGGEGVALSISIYIDPLITRKEQWLWKRETSSRIASWNSTKT
jgi:hypothetical protein